MSGFSAVFSHEAGHLIRDHARYIEKTAGKPQSNRPRNPIAPKSLAPRGVLWFPIYADIGVGRTSLTKFLNPVGNRKTKEDQRLRDPIQTE